jgi:hypothetical protein
MAQAAEDAVWWASWQTKLGIAGFVAVVLSLIFTGWAAVAAGQAAAAGHQSVRVAQDTAQFELRPYIINDGLTWSWLHAPDNLDKIHSWRFELKWKNSGQTPGRNVHCWVNIQSFPKGATPESIGFADTSNYESRGNPVGPGQSFPSRLTIPLAELIATWNNERDLYYWAWVEYDGITPNARHRSEACARLELKSNPATDKKLVIVDIVATRFNAMDGECIHKPKTTKDT